MRSIVIAVLGVSTLAAADERDAAVRAGVALIGADGDQGLHGFAPYVDGELGLRTRYASLTGAGSIFSLRSHFSWSDQDIWVDSDARYVAFDLGFRVTLHGESREGPFWGIGLGFETVYETGRAATYTCANDLCDPRTGPGYQPFRRWKSVPLGKVHAGFDVDTGSGLLDVIAIAGYGGDPDHGTSGLWTLRLAAGLRF